MTTAVARQRALTNRSTTRASGADWWIFLITGTAWLFFALILFRFNITSAKSIGILAGIVFLIAGLFEFAMTAVVKEGWWKALNAILGVLLVVGGILSFIHPENAFVAVASITGFMFLFVGILDVIVALVRPNGRLVGAADRRDRVHRSSASGRQATSRGARRSSSPGSARSRCCAGSTAS